MMRFWDGSGISWTMCKQSAPCHKGKTSLDLNKAKDDEVLGRQWHQLDHMQTICTLLQTDNHTNTSSLNFKGRMLFLTPNQQRQSTDGNTKDMPGLSNHLTSHCHHMTISYCSP